MAAALQTSFAGLRLGATVQKRNAFVSNGNAQKLAMKAKHTFQVEVSNEFRTAAYLDNGMLLRFREHCRALEAVN